MNRSGLFTRFKPSPGPVFTFDGLDPTGLRAGEVLVTFCNQLNQTARKRFTESSV